jgi:hypothetical protein
MTANHHNNQLHFDDVMLVAGFELMYCAWLNFCLTV